MAFTGPVPCAWRSTGRTSRRSRRGSRGRGSGVTHECRYVILTPIVSTVVWPTAHPPSDPRRMLQRVICGIADGRGLVRDGHDGVVGQGARRRAGPGVDVDLPAEHPTVLIRSVDVHLLDPGGIDDGELTSRSTCRRIRQSADASLPASAATSAASRDACPIESEALNANENSISPIVMVMKIGKTSANSTRDCPRDDARPAGRRLRRRFMYGSPEVTRRVEDR